LNRVPKEERLWATLRTSLFAALFISFFVVYLPWIWAIRGRQPSYDGWGVLRLAGALPLAAGAYVTLRCVFALAWTGLGTPAPFDPPRRLVVTGFYRYVRNPMYLGAAMTIVGETTLLGSLREGLLYAGLFLACLAVFVVAYEEPALRVKFGEEYDEYCRNVPRFVARLRPWKWPTPPVQ
jgi:protein-S-isoprenylcysteine O-methyltransferase Ste14